MPIFTSYPLRHGRLEDLSRDEFPSLVSGWLADRLALDADGTHFVFVLEGAATLRCASGRFELGPGMYAAVPGAMSVEAGKGMVVTGLNYRGFFHLGGPIEGTGRLRYIDGCTDSLLIPPVMRGDPCLNLLCLPPGVRQTAHVHPSVRIGLIVRGSGWCVTPDGRVALAAGQVFRIQAQGVHHFHTDDESLVVVAYHPDSDFGPTHEDHPMINRTILPHE